MDLNQVTIPSIDLYRSTAFYETLGLQLIVDSKPHYVRFELPEGNATFSIHKVEELPVVSGVVVYFEVKELEQIVNTLIEKGIKFESKPEEKSWLWKEATLLDPDGNQIILYTAGKNRKNPPWRINKQK